MIEPRRLHRGIGASQAVDLCFLMDATDSMASWIGLTKGKITKIIKSVQNIYPASKFFISVVVYRDFDEGDKSFQVLPFTSSASDVVNFLSGVEPRGGDDEAEDINGGFQKLLKLQWSNQTKILFHFADAPCHGSKYSNESDKYPNPSSDISWEKIFRQIKSLGMDYYFMRIKSNTDRMTAAFADYWNTCKPYFRNGSERRLVFQVQPIEEDSMKFISDGGDISIDELNNPPSCNLAEENSTEVEGVLVKGSSKRIDVILEKGFEILEEKSRILIQHTPFAHGSFNHAYAAKLCATGHKMVAKKPLEGIKFDENLLKLDLKKKGIAITLANSFNQKLIPLRTYPWACISFVHTFLFKTRDELYVVEGLIDGKYVKYANNLDEIDNTKEIRHFTAFAH
jgi:hypothetical protein